MSAYVSRITINTISPLFSTRDYFCCHRPSNIPPANHFNMWLTIDSRIVDSLMSCCRRVARNYLISKVIHCTFLNKTLRSFLTTQKYITSLLPCLHSWSCSYLTILPARPSSPPPQSPQSLSLSFILHYPAFQAFQSLKTSEPCAHQIAKRLRREAFSTSHTHHRIRHREARQDQSEVTEAPAVRHHTLLFPAHRHQHPDRPAD